MNSITSYYVEFENDIKWKRSWAIAGIVSNLIVLIFFKYSPLFSSTFSNPGNSVGEFLISIPLPIGISFFTFQGISLVVDTFRSRDEMKFRGVISGNKIEHLKSTFLFISFFPQLVAGPIVKAHDFIPQIKSKFLKDIDWEFAFKAIVIGYFLKMVIADNIKEQTFWIEYPYFQGHSSTVLIVLLFGYSIQIFADFAGYSSIAIGLAAMFGYRLRDNFNFPYISTSFSEFWRRWHISLSSFLKEYLYIPLGGNQKGSVRTYINLFIVMFLGGLWHGAAWSYAVWGTFHGLALAVERFLQKNVNFGSAAPEILVTYQNASILSLSWRLIKVVLKTSIVFVFVTLAWLLFKLSEFEHALIYIKNIIINNFQIGSSKINLAIIGLIVLYSIPVIAYHLYYLYREKYPNTNFKKFEPIVYGIMIFSIITNSGIPGSFIYFQF